MVLRAATSVSTGTVLEMHILSTQSSCPRPTKLETLGVGPSNLCFNKLPGNSDAYLGTTTVEAVALILNYNE